MKSNYRKIGDFIQLVDERNKDLKVTKLLGLSISKQFIPSVANTIGTNMKNYKIIRKNQFACSTMQVRRDKKMPIALLQDFEEAIISQAYPVFKIIDETILNSEYLMMWFSRSEFDRHACFLAIGGVRGSLEWEDFLEMPIPVPSIEKQHEIVKEYNTVANRITLNETINKKLEDTAQALYKHWFVDFEFPNKQGKPYKSNGGKMVFNEELDLEIPLGWENNKLGNLIESFSKSHNFIKNELIFFNTSDILKGEFLHNNYSSIFKMPGQAKKSIKKGDILYSEIRPKNKRFALVRIESEDYVVSTKLMVLRRISENISVYRLYHFLTSDNFIEILQQSSEGRSGTFPQITFELDIEKKNILIANNNIEILWNDFLTNFYLQTYSRKDENKLLHKFKNLLLSKMSKVAIEKETVC
ncbi:restriction endonuclease subunit S [Tenacibaculum finnmarkense genomovar ulcerans]|uniref:restriction endonuclease subunit S n=1 Tax=Tenacibaculum finnmarkense TaxID=2781243 RepID=UPI001E51436A|nr:restriction endonuclease subunit S [Tenacibaculum finnmarkense]MCD8431044.1 restriction endonuclease subunit S [Tenacibaculum finnmarkense genomovar ulcerans]